MPATMTQNPISDLMYDWLTVLQSKAEGLSAYEQYIHDAEKENAQAVAKGINGTTGETFLVELPGRAEACFSPEPGGEDTESR